MLRDVAGIAVAVEVGSVVVVAVAVGVGVVVKVGVGVAVDVAVAVGSVVEVACGNAVAVDATSAAAVGVTVEVLIPAQAVSVTAPMFANTTRRFRRFTLFLPCCSDFSPARRNCKVNQG